MFANGFLKPANSTSKPVNQAVVQANVAGFEVCLDAELQALRERLVARVEELLSRGMAAQVELHDEITVDAKSSDLEFKAAPDPCAAIGSLPATGFSFAALAQSVQSQSATARGTTQEMVSEVDEMFKADEYPGLAQAEQHDMMMESSEPLENWAFLVFMMGFGNDSGYEPKERPIGLQLETRATWLSIAGAAMTRRRQSETTADLNEQHNANKLRSGDALTETRCRWLQCFVMHPHRWRRITWGCLTVLVILWDAITIPLQLFDLGSFGRTMDMISQVTLVFWILDIFANFCTGLDKGGVLDLRASVIARTYIAGWFLADVAMVLSDVVILTSLSDKQEAQLSTLSRSSRLPRIIRLVRLVRLMRARKAFITFDVLLDSLQSSWVLVSLKLAQLLLITMIINHYVACSWYGLAFYNETGPRWTDNVLVEDSNPASLYLASLHWSLTQFSPATQNIGPTNEAERAFSIVIVIAALGLLTSLAGSITKYTTDMRQINAAQVTLDLRLRQFFMSRRMSTDLAARIKSFVKHANFKHDRLQHEADLPLLKALPESLQVRMHNELYRPVLMASPLFSLVNEINWALLSSICHTSLKEKSVPPYFDIFMDNTQTDQALFTVAGRMWYSQDQSLNDFWTEATDTSSLRGDGIRPRSEARKKRSRRAVNERINFIYPETWLSEMALWSEWSHRGYLHSETAADMITLDAERLFRACSKHKGPTLAILQKVAIFSVAHVIKLGEEGENVSDLGFDGKAWQQIFYRATKMGQHDRAGIWNI